MQKVKLQAVSAYANRGQNLEQNFRYTMTGELVKADRVQGADFDDIQIKSARATIGRGLDIDAIVDNEKANRFAYITADNVAYIMTKEEYRAFVKQFHVVDHESKQNGGAPKFRITKESKALLAYLQR